MDNLVPAVLAPLAFLLLFPLFWCGICWLLAQVGGWARLAQRFATHQTPRGTPFHWQSGSLGWVSYRGVLQLDAAHDGLFLAMPWLFRVGHAPLFLPWAELHHARELRVLWLRFVRVEVGQPPSARLRLPAKVLEATPAGRALLAALP
jgi:hypothetical protein